MCDTDETHTVHRVSHTVSFKLDVCNYFEIVPNATIAGAARFYNISRKQVRYFRKHEENYRSMSTRRSRRNVIRPDQVRMRAKYSDEEGRVYKWFIETRSQGTSIRFEILLSDFFTLSYLKIGLVVSKEAILKKMLSELGNAVKFTGSNGWLDRFCKRYSLKTRRITGSGKELPENLVQVIWDHIEEVNDLIDVKG